MNLLPLLAVPVAVVVGLVAGPALTGDPVPGEGSVEVGFSRDMQVHHAQAVLMSSMAFDRSRDPEVRAIALDVVTTQSGQLGTMAGWLEEWELLSRGTEPQMAWMSSVEGGAHGGDHTGPDGAMPGMATQAELDQLAAARGTAFDLLWVRLLRDHHAGGVEMMEAAIDGTDRPSVEDLAEKMLSGQTAEIEVLDELGARLAAASSPA